MLFFIFLLPLPLLLGAILRSDTYPATRRRRPTYHFSLYTNYSFPWVGT